MAPGSLSPSLALKPPRSEGHQREIGKKEWTLEASAEVATRKKLER